MNTRKTGAGLASALLATVILTACGDVQDEGKNDGYAEGWQPGNYAAAPQHLVEGVDSTIRAELAHKPRLDAMPKDGWHGQLLLQGQDRQDGTVNRFQPRFE
jgi:hypothetical protein